MCFLPRTIRRRELIALQRNEYKKTMELLDGRDKPFQFHGRVRNRPFKDEQPFILNKVFEIPFHEISSLPGFGGPDWLKNVNRMYREYHEKYDRLIKSEYPGFFQYRVLA